MSLGKNESEGVLSRNVKRVLLWGLTPFAVLLGSAAVANAWTAEDTNWIASNQPVYADKLRALFEKVESRFAALERAGSGTPTGTIVAYAAKCDNALAAGAAGGPPSGWMCCTGTPVSRTDPKYAPLFTVIGVTWGDGNGTSTFALPDLRGRFLRGVDSGAGVDKDAASRSAQCRNAGCSAAEAGSLQAGSTALPLTPFSTNLTGNHSHGAATGTEISYPNYGVWYDQYIANGPACPQGQGIGFMDTARHGGSHRHPITEDGNHQHVVTGGGDKETRPVNAAVNFIIKL